jgi:hypothetical protein
MRLALGLAFGPLLVTPSCPRSVGRGSASRLQYHLSVTWRAKDAQPSVAWYDVAVNIDGGPYTPWLTHTTQPRAAYAGERDH